MTYDITYRYTPAFAKRVYRQYLWRAASEWIVATTVIALASIYLLWKTDYGLYGAFLLGVVSVFWYGWWSQSNVSGQLAAHLRDASLTVTIDLRGCRISSPEATTEF